MSKGTVSHDRTSDTHFDGTSESRPSHWYCLACVGHENVNDICEICSTPREANGSQEVPVEPQTTFSYGMFRHRNGFLLSHDDSDSPQESGDTLTDRAVNSVANSHGTTENMSSTPKSDLHSPASSGGASPSTSVTVVTGGASASARPQQQQQQQHQQHQQHQQRRATPTSTPETDSPRSNGSEMEAVLDNRGAGTSRNGTTNGQRRRYTGTRSGSSTPLSESRASAIPEYEVSPVGGLGGGEELEMSAWRYVFQFRTKVCQRWLNGTSCNATVCFDTHSSVPARRPPFERQEGWSYGPERCLAQTELECPNGSDCRMAHTEEEVLYHPLMYRTRLCTRPKGDPSAPVCLYGAHCPYAHSTQLLRRPRRLGGPAFGTITAPSPAMSVMPPPPAPTAASFVRDAGPVGLPTSEPLTDEQRCYYMFEYKTGQCLRSVCQCGQICDAYHSATERRRSPRDWAYSEHPCPNVKTPGPEARWGNPELCNEGEQCPFSHTRLEQMYHPNTYKTSLCNRAQASGGCAWGERCSHAHGQADLSKPERSMMLATMDRSLYQPSTWPAAAPTAPPRRHVVVTRPGQGGVVTLPAARTQNAHTPRGPHAAPSGPGVGRGRPVSLLPAQQQQPVPRGSGGRPGLPGGAGTPGGASAGGSPFGETIRFPMHAYEEMMRELEELKERDRIRAVEAEQFAVLGSKLKALQEARQCPLCYESRRDTALTPCGHVVCGNCAGAARTCPLCHVAVTGTLALRY